MHERETDWLSLCELGDWQATRIANLHITTEDFKDPIWSKRAQGFVKERRVVIDPETRTANVNDVEAILVMVKAEISVVAFESTVRRSSSEGKERSKRIRFRGN
jgi:hypothetical protein